MRDTDSIHIMGVEELLGFIVGASDKLTKDKNRLILVKNRITKLQGYLKRCSDLVDLLSEED